MKRFLAITALIASFSQLSTAQTTPTDPLPPRDSKVYTSSSLDGALFSMSTSSYNGITNIPRFSYFINSGMNVNKDFSSHFGMYAGFGVKNLGYIEKGNTTSGVSITVKRRVYAVGIPLGFKFGNLKPKGTFGLIGGGVDFPTNYKIKTFTDGRKNKTKSNEWFSKEVTPVMPYVFAGISLKGNFTIRFQYYPGNFMNQDYKDANGAKIYSNMESKLALVSLSFNVKNKSDGKMSQTFKAIFHHEKKKA